MQRQAAKTQRAFGDQIRIGMLAGETNRDLVKRIRGTQIPGAPRGTFTGGVLQTSTREANTLVRTSVQQIANQTREETYRENADIIKGVQALVVLDTRTS